MFLEAYSGIDIQLKKRYNLIPNLIEMIKGYTHHEMETFTNVIKARNEAVLANTIESQQKAETQLSNSLTKLFALVEKYQDLKSSENFRNIQKELVDIEDDIEKSRLYYNGTVRAYNIKIKTFPSNIIARLFNFTLWPFFEISSDQRELTRVNFTN